MLRYRLFNYQVSRTGLFLAVVLTLVLATLPTAVMAAPATAPAAGQYYGHHGCDDCYIVQPGDTLSEIAKWFGVPTWVLAKYNHISDPNKIYVGQKIYIPPGGCGGCGYDDSYHHDGDCGNCGGYDDSYHHDGGCGNCDGYDDAYHHDGDCGNCGGYDDSYHHDGDCGNCGGYDDAYHHDGGCNECGGNWYYPTPHHY